MEAQKSFGRYAHLFALRQNNSADARSGSDSRADRGPLATADKCADQRSDSGSASNHHACLLVGSKSLAALLRQVASAYYIPRSRDRERVNIEDQVCSGGAPG